MMLKSLLKDLVNNLKKPADREFTFSADERARASTELVAQLSRSDYVNFPFIVSLETQAVCNAACSFCPYSSMDRKGERMSDELIDKIISDLEQIPASLPFTILPYKVSEPFVEPRIFTICEKINARLPNAKISFISNGGALSAAKIDKLLELKNIGYLNISLNFISPEQYESVMRIPFQRTLENIDLLHSRAIETGGFHFPVRITRVSGTKAEDAAYLRWVASRYPLFQAVITNRNDWIGNCSSDDETLQVPDTACSRWFDFSITATGEVAMCCMDGNAEYSKGNVKQQSVLEIYGQGWLKDLRQNAPGRQTVGAPCNRCTYSSATRVSKSGNKGAELQAE